MLPAGLGDHSADPYTNLDGAAFDGSTQWLEPIPDALTSLTFPTP
ncbi:hypothetical protein MGAST_13740 [Mycobacterium gastri 'Wayne']|nr:hypothetical protein MGAST_13740 [Mycobacterium gastri 'Wayne']